MTQSHPLPAHRIAGKDGQPTRDQPWIIRTYAGHSNAAASNRLYRANLASGQTGLSIAFDLPTQCGYDSDDPIARPEVGKVGVPINSLDDMLVLLDGIPVETVNTSMTINGTAMWLLALYVALARERGIDTRKLTGTTQNDLIKEYLARGTYIFPPEQSLRIIAEMYEYCLGEIPSWNASNICSYHLQEAGATPVQELAFALANALSLLDLLQQRGRCGARFPEVVGRISFFVNAGIRFIEEMCKMRAFSELWDELTRDRYGVADARYRRFRYGVQVNSLGLTESQPENNAWRILIEALGVTLSRNARCRALQLPAWNEALSLPRPWDQQWSIRLQQILAYETDLLEYPDLFDGSPVIQAKVAELKRVARQEIDTILGLGGVIPAIESGYMKSALVRSMSERMTAINSGQQVVVGMNKWKEGLPSPLVGGDDGGIFSVDAAAVEQALASLETTRKRRDPVRVAEALARLREAASGSGDSMMEASIECALARVTTGEWAGTLRGVFGEYRPPTGVDGQRLGLSSDRVDALRQRIGKLTATLGHRPRIVVGKPGLDGHSNGAEVIAVSARHVGFDVIYSGIRLSAQAIVQSAVEEDADLIGASVLSGSHLELAGQIMEQLRELGADRRIQVVFGGIIPKGDFEKLRALGVARVFTPSDFELIDIMESITEVIEAAR